MEIFDSIAIIVAKQHLDMLNILLLIAMIIFTIYSGILLGSTFFSVWYRNMYRKTGNDNHIRLSVDLIDVMTSNPTMWFGFGLIPMLACTMMYLQLMAGTGTTTPAILLVGFIVYALGIAVIYFYKHSAHFTFFYEYFRKQDNVDENDYHYGQVHEYNESLHSLSGSAGFWGITLLIVGVWIFLTGSHYAMDEAMWNKIAIRNMLSAPVLFKLLHFVAAGFAMGAATFVFLRYFWNSGANYDNDQYSDYARRINTGIALGSLAAQPILLAATMVYTPVGAASSLVYVYSALAIVLAFISANILFTMLKERSAEMIKYGYWSILLIFVFFIFKEHKSFTNSNSNNVARIAHLYEIEEMKRAAEGGEAVEVDGSLIYKNRCAACHKFDVAQITAPAYKDVLGKYEGKMEDLSAFILNPQPRGNPNPVSGGTYGPMPNQGVSKAEAEAVAKYLWQEFTGETGEEAPVEDEATGGGETAEKEAASAE